MSLLREKRGIVPNPLAGPVGDRLPVIDDGGVDSRSHELHDEAVSYGASTDDHDIVERCHGGEGTSRRMSDEGAIREKQSKEGRATERSRTVDGSQSSSSVDSSG